MKQGNEKTNRTLRYWGIATVPVVIVVYLANVLLGPLNQDEGWYLYAAQLVSNGIFPHRDFFFTQGGIMPAFYAAFEWAWAPFGLLGGRLFTMLLSLLALLCATRTINHLYPESPHNRSNVTLLLWAFLGLNLWYTYFTAIPKAYALCTLGIALAFYLLAFTDNRAHHSGRNAAFAGVLLALVAGIRLSMGILLPIVTLWLFFYRKKFGEMAWLFFAISGFLGCALVLGVPLLLWTDSFLEAQHFHVARASMGLLGMAGCVARWIRFNPLLVFALLLLLVFRPVVSERLKPYVYLWGLSATALLFIHLFAPVPYDDYAIPAFLPLAMMTATLLPALPLGAATPRLMKAYVVLALLLTVIGAPLVQDWFVLRQDRFWIELKSEPDLIRLRKAGAELRAAAERLGTDTVWTQDTYLAVEAGLRVPAGLEMGPFSQPHLISSKAPLAAWSGYTFALDYPTLVPATDREQRLRELQTIYDVPLLVLPDFGQAHTTLTIAEKSLP